MNEKINILVVEDSPAARALIVHILNSDTALNVIGTAGNGADALEFLRHRKPDVIVTDTHMSVMDGYEMTRKIMETRPIPIIVCTASLNPDEVKRTFLALEAGALAVVAKPLGLLHPDYADIAAGLVEKVKLMSEIRLVRRVNRGSPATSAFPVSPAPVIRPSSAPIRVVAIGTSTGGPPVLHTILSGLPADFPVPVLIVQHIATGFLPGLAEWLNATTGFPVHIGVHGERALAGTRLPRSRRVPHGIFTRGTNRPVQEGARERAASRHLLSFPIGGRDLRRPRRRGAAHRHGQRRRGRAQIAP